MAATKYFNAITSMLNLSISCFNANNAWSISGGSGILPSRLVNGRKLISKLCVTSLPEPAERREAACGERPASVIETQDGALAGRMGGGCHNGAHLGPAMGHAA